MSQPAAAARRTARNRAPPGEVRIIGGRWKRTRLTVVDRPGLRPTPDRVRETLFNWLGQDLTGWRCVDVFGGSGALGFEAASRGAVDVMIWEQDAALIEQLREVRERLGAGMVRIEHCDGLAALESLHRASCDLVFLDPPFDAAALAGRALKGASTAIGPTGRIYFESPVTWAGQQLGPLGLARLKYLRAGSVHAHLLACAA